MIVTKKAISTPHRASRPRSRCFASAARRDDSCADRRAEHAGQSRAPAGGRLSPERRRLRELAAERGRRRLRVLARARAARAVPRSRDHHHRARRSPGGSARRRRRRSLTRIRLVPDRRAREEVGHHRRELGVDGSDCGGRVRARDAAVVAAAHRRQQQPGRIVRHGLQLRVQQHAVVADADAAADVRKRSARGLRAPVRIERQHRSARAGACGFARTGAFSIR